MGQCWLGSRSEQQSKSDTFYRNINQKTFFPFKVHVRRFTPKIFQYGTIKNSAEFERSVLCIKSRKLSHSMVRLPLPTHPSCTFALYVFLKFTCISCVLLSYAEVLHCKRHPKRIYIYKEHVFFSFQNERNVFCHVQEI